MNEIKISQVKFTRTLKLPEVELTEAQKAEVEKRCIERMEQINREFEAFVLRGEESTIFKHPKPTGLLGILNTSGA